MFSGKEPRIGLDFYGAESAKSNTGFPRTFQVFNGNSRSLGLCCLIIIHAFCRYITGWTQRKMLDVSAGYFYSAPCGVPAASIRWPVCAKHRPDPSGLGHLSGGKTVNLQCYKHRRHTQTQSQPSVCGCAKGTSVRIQFKKSCGSITPNQPSSLSSSERSLRNPGKTELPRFHLRRIFFSFPFFFKKTRFNWCEGRERKSGHWNSRSQRPPRASRYVFLPNGKLQHGDPKSSFSLDIAGEADGHVNIRVADWNSHVSILHPCGQLEWPCFHITSVWPTGTAMFPYYIRVADWSSHVSILHPCGQLEWPYFHITSL